VRGRAEQPPGTVLRAGAGADRPGRAGRGRDAGPDHRPGGQHVRPGAAAAGGREPDHRQAVTAARQHVASLPGHTAIEWTTPVLFMHEASRHGWLFKARETHEEGERVVDPRRDRKRAMERFQGSGHINIGTLLAAVLHVREEGDWDRLLRMMPAKRLSPQQQWLVAEAEVELAWPKLARAAPSCPATATRRRRPNCWPHRTAGGPVALPGTRGRAARDLDQLPARAGRPRTARTGRPRWRTTRGARPCAGRLPRCRTATGDHGRPRRGAARYAAAQADQAAQRCPTRRRPTPRCISAGRRTTRTRRPGRLRRRPGRRRRRTLDRRRVRLPKLPGWATGPRRPHGQGHRPGRGRHR